MVKVSTAAWSGREWPRAGDGRHAVCMARPSAARGVLRGIVAAHGSVDCVAGPRGLARAANRLCLAAAYHDHLPFLLYAACSSRSVRMANGTVLGSGLGGAGRGGSSGRVAAPNKTSYKQTAGQNQLQTNSRACEQHSLLFHVDEAANAGELHPLFLSRRCSEPPQQAIASRMC